MRIARTERIAMPAIGLGTFQITGEDAARIVERALAEGYRHIDTARIYRNEAEVGAGMARSAVPRDRIFLTTKIWIDDFRAADLERATEESLRDLRTDYVDLLLLHWPSKEVPIDDTLEGLAAVARQGKARHVGLSNFTIPQFREAEAKSAVPLAVNQVEYHPYLDQRPMLAFLAERGAMLTAYSPLAQGKLFGDPVLERIAGDHGASAGDVALAWILSAPNASVIPKTQNPDRLAPNLRAAEIALTEAEIAEITALARPDGRIVSPAGIAPDWDA
jgi:diketogulonate reductase-like aldo/keto reductase